MTGSTPAPSVPAPCEQIARIVIGFWQSLTLVAAADLELADLLAEGPLHVDDIANRTKTHSSTLFRLLRALESVGVFAQVSPRVFANTPASECLRKNVPGSQWALVRMNLSTGGGLFEAWAGLMGSIQTGKRAFDEILGCSYWQFLQRNPDRWAIFNEAMRSAHGAMAPAVANSYDWSRFPVIADIGGGTGAQLVAILNACPSSRGILFDQPDVVAGAIPHDRVERIGGDFFQSIPTGADAYILGCVIHDWAEPEAMAIVGNVRQAMKPGSRIALIERVVPETPEFALTKWMDLQMLIALGGRERTATEYGELLSAAGFELEQIVPTPSSVSVLITRPR